MCGGGNVTGGDDEQELRYCLGVDPSNLASYDHIYDPSDPKVLIWVLLGPSSISGPPQATLTLLGPF